MKKDNTTPHIKVVGGLWYCLDAFWNFYGMGYDAVSAYSDWEDMRTSYAEQSMRIGSCA